MDFSKLSQNVNWHNTVRLDHKKLSRELKDVHGNDYFKALNLKLQASSNHLMPVKLTRNKHILVNLNRDSAKFARVLRIYMNAYPNLQNKQKSLSQATATNLIKDADNKHQITFDIGRWNGYMATPMSFYSQRLEINKRNDHRSYDTVHKVFMKKLYGRKLVGFYNSLVTIGGEIMVACVKKSQYTTYMNFFTSRYKQFKNPLQYTASRMLCKYIFNYCHPKSPLE